MLNTACNDHARSHQALVLCVVVDVLGLLLVVAMPRGLEDSSCPVVPGVLVTIAGLRLVILAIQPLAAVMSCTTPAV